MRLRPRCWFLAAACVAGPVHADGSLGVQTQDPRAFGWQLGDVARRRVVIHAPAGLSLDAASLPRVRQPGQPVELSALRWRRESEGPGSRYEIDLVYQVFVSPPEVRTLEMPPLRLRFTGTGPSRDLRVEAWPLTVGPLAPAEVSARAGLGEMQPDAPPPRIATHAAERRLRLLAAVAVACSLYLASVYVGLPWWSRRHRPFDRAWRVVSSGVSLPGSARAFHAALNAVAGEVVFAGDVDRFVAARPAWQPLRAELAGFFDLSRRVFFADEAPGSGDADALRRLCRRARDVERGAA